MAEKLAENIDVKKEMATNKKVGVLSGASEAPAFDDQGKVITGEEVTRYNQNAVTRNADKLKNSAEEQSRKDKDISKSNSLMANARSEAFTSEGHLEEKRKKEEKSMRFALSQAQKQLDALNQQIAANNERIGEIDKELSEIDKLEELIEDGELDPNNPAHRKLMDKYGITEESIADGTWVVILGTERQPRREEKSDLEKKNEELEQKRVEIRNGTQQDRAAGTLIKAHDEDQQQKARQSLDQIAEGQTDSSVRDKSVLLSDQKDIAEISGEEAELENFMKEYAKAKTIEDPTERMTREKELVAGLSEDAAEIASMEEETMDLFEPGYFDPLDHKTELAMGAPAAALNFS